MRTFVNLNGALSQFTPPGEILNMKPKSIWMRCPVFKRRMLPLCLSLNYRRYETSEYPARLSMKFFYASLNSSPNVSRKN